MKAYVASPPNLSQAMFRVARALEQYRPPGVRLARREAEADLVLLHTIGFPETEQALDRLRDKQVVIAQYCLRSTQRPSTRDWLPLWRRARMVWSYYDLAALAREDGVEADLTNFHLSPLGVDPSVFKPYPRAGPRVFTMFTSGYVAESEAVRECSEAVRRVNGRLFHLGPPTVAPGPHVTSGLGLEDSVLALRYNQSRFVAGLRRVEGFELPAAEGLLCGARPIMFDRPHYRRWFDGLAYFIPEAEPAEVTDHLIEIFQRHDPPVSHEDRREAVGRFAWATVAEAFWNRVIGG